MVRLLKCLFALVLTVIITTKAHAAVLQEGWYKIMSGGQHVGFIVLRIEFDEKKKQFTSTSFTQTSPLAGNLKESLVAVAGEKMDPVSYMFTSQIGQLAKVIDANFNKNIMTATVKEGDKSTPVQNKLEKGTFLSQFLVYVVLQSKQGFKVGNNFAYSAIAEEEAQAYNGEAFVQSSEKYQGLDAYKVMVTFKKTKYVNYVTPKGIILMTKSPIDSLSTELVANPDAATKGFDVNRKHLTLLFKNVPGGSTLIKEPVKTEPAKPEATKPEPAKATEPVPVTPPTTVPPSKE